MLVLIAWGGFSYHGPAQPLVRALATVVVAAYAADVSGSTLLVPLLRTAYVAERDTLARQLLSKNRVKFG